MKITFLTMLSMLASGGLQAQDCAGAFYFKEGQTVVYEKHDKNGKPAGRDVATVSNVKQDNGVSTARYSQVKYDAANKIKEEGYATVTCNASELRIGFQIPQTNGSGSTEAYFSYPSDMRPGRELEAQLNMHVKGETKGKKMDVTFKIQNRRVLAEESVKTPAGIFKAFKIGYDMDVRFKVVGIGIPMKVKVLEWYSPGAGVVKTETFNKDGALEERSVLSSLQ